MTAVNCPLLDRVRIVLVGTTHPGNIGASARAMKAMGLSKLYLVAPKTFPSAEATARAAGADDVLQAAHLCTDLEEALSGCDLAYGTTARSRHIRWPVVPPRRAAQRLLSHPGGGDIALVFGRERSGLSNVELELCHSAVVIPTAADFHSLNIAQAVQICGYELRMAAPPDGGLAAPEQALPEADPPAALDELEAAYAHVLGTMRDVGYFDPERPKLLPRRLRRWLSRAALLHSEVQILRGFLSAVDARIAVSALGEDKPRS